jgi:hypothetical protein
LVQRRIDIARFECGTCGHWSTPPEAINAFPEQMEDYSAIEATILPDPETTEIFKETLEEQHKGNAFAIHQKRKEGIPSEGELDLAPELEPESYIKVIKVNRSYCKVAVQSHTNLEESNHIVLACPNCDTTLYEVRWGK